MTRSRKRKLLRLLESRSGRSIASSLSLAPLMLAGVPFAHAQDAAQGAILEEVVVTAQKQQENLQAVPMSIQAFGAAKLDELRITNMTDYLNFMPSVSFQSGGPASHCRATVPDTVPSAERSMPSGAAPSEMLKV